MKYLAIVTLSALTALSGSTLCADTFGTGANQFSIDFVPIGAPGNIDDTTGLPVPAGKVDYGYRIGKYEISEDMVNKANTLGGLGLTHDNRGANKPATSLSWYEAAKFVNWLNGNTPAYKFDSGGNFQLWAPGDAGYNPNNLFRNRLAKYFLPSMDEWYKAAYYNPDFEIYYDYPTGSNLAPDGIDFSGDTIFDAVFNDGGSNGGPNDITDVGVLSPFGTAGQGGNVSEWNETNLSLVNGNDLNRIIRGGFWVNSPTFLQSSFYSSNTAPNGLNWIGFRVASVPEPNASLLASVSALGILLRRKRMG